MLKEKLKGLKAKIKEWNKEEYRGMKERVERLVGEIARLVELSEEVGGLSMEEVEVRKSNFEELWRLLKAKDALVAQRSRSKWHKEGDVNTKYFHNYVKVRKSRNSIKALRENDGWVVSPYDVRRKMLEYFKNIVANDRWERPKLDGVNFERVSEEDNIFLAAPFSILEIEAVVRDSDGGKSRGSNGYNFAFVKEFWYLIKDEVRIMFDQFHTNEVLPKGMLSYFVTLIPKVSSPLELKEYKPISLLGCLYKLLVKVLARRLTVVLNSIISQNQSPFLRVGIWWVGCWL